MKLGDKRFFALVEEVVPPLLSVDFESDNGGFTVLTTEGSDWEYGTPNSSSPGGAVTGGNGGSLKCWGTVISSPGHFTDPTTTCLRSPVVDLSQVSDAELSFAQALDMHPSDTITVNIIDDTTDAVIVSDLIALSDTDDFAANWESVGPVSIPAAAIGQPVRIEWCLSGVGGASKDYMGWYIDDVMVLEVDSE